MKCIHCDSDLTKEDGVLVDDTGGDVCPIASLDFNENRPHGADYD
jgi:hypothetical protein